jgi:hypothetical protein
MSDLSTDCYAVYRSALIAEMYECNLQDEEAPSLSSVRDSCYTAAQRSAAEWSNTELAHWYINYR